MPCSVYSQHIFQQGLKLIVPPLMQVLLKYSWTKLSVISSHVCVYYCGSYIISVFNKMHVILNLILYIIAIQSLESGKIIVCVAT